MLEESPYSMYYFSLFFVEVWLEDSTLSFILSQSLAQFYN